MCRTTYVASALLLSGILFPRPTLTQEKAGSTEPKMTEEDVAKKNPIAPTAEGLAEARKFFGYNCAMCHGKAGDGKGDLAADMKLELRDWRDSAALEKLTDGELFWIISNGKGKMPGNGERDPEKMRWKYVNLVRSFAKKGAATEEKPKTENPPALNLTSASAFQLPAQQTQLQVWQPGDSSWPRDMLVYRILKRSRFMAHAPQFLKLVNESKKKVKETNVAEVKRRLDAGEKLLLVDVREDNEWASGHIPAAIHMGKGIIERDIESQVPDTSAKLILYCGGGFRSALAADNLQKMGYSNVESMDGGWKGWVSAGLPTAKG